MKFYRIEDSTDLKEVGIFPQRREMNVGLHKDDPRHLFNQPAFAALPKDVYIPSFKLHPKAKLTDVISSPINSDWIVSSKLKAIFEMEQIANVEFVPIYLYKKDLTYEYFLLRSLASRMESIDFYNTVILIKKVLSQEEQEIQVNDFNAFQELSEEVEYPRYIQIDKFRIKAECDLKFFTLKYTYGLITHFISENFKDILIKNKCTGIRYMELDEV